MPLEGFWIRGLRIPKSSKFGVWGPHAPGSLQPLAAQEPPGAPRSPQEPPGAPRAFSPAPQRQKMPSFLRGTKAKDVPQSSEAANPGPPLRTWLFPGRQAPAKVGDDLLGTPPSLEEAWMLRWGNPKKESSKARSFLMSVIKSVIWNFRFVVWELGFRFRGVYGLKVLISA